MKQCQITQSGFPDHHHQSSRAKTFVAAVLGLVFSLTGAEAATITKAATGTDLTAGASWGGTAPGSGDVATWSSTSLGGPLTLSSANAWGGLAVSGASSDITITGAGPLTLGSSGISFAAAAVNLNLGVPLTLNGNQAWTGSTGGELLTASGNITGAGLTIGSVVSGGNTQQGTVSLTGANNSFTSVTIANGTLNLTGQNSIPTLTIDQWNTAKGINAFLNISNGGILSFATLALATQNTGKHVTPVIHLDNGILESSSTATIAGSLSIQIDTGGATINTAGGNVTSSSPFLHGSGAPDGGLTVTGGNTFTLPNGASTFTGPITIGQATLALSSSTSLPNTAGITINGGGTLDVSSVAGGLSWGATETLTATGTNATGTIKGNVTLADTSPLAFNLTPGTAPLNVTAGTLAVGADGPVTINIVNGGKPLSAGTYALITAGAGGSADGAAPVSVAFTGDGLATGTTNALEINNGELDLVVGGGAPVLVSSLSNSNLVLNWPASGWQLQAQTNTLSGGLGTNWISVGGSTLTNSATIPIDPHNRAVFFRLVSP